MLHGDTRLARLVQAFGHVRIPVVGLLTNRDNSVLLDRDVQHGETHVVQ